MTRRPPTSTWHDRQRQRRASPFFRLLDRSFGFRVLIAAALSFGLLAAVNRFENCHDPSSQPDCLTTDFLDIISIGNVESFSIITAAIVYLLEAGKRKEWEHHEMFELLLAQREARASNSLGRLRALEHLSAAGLWQDDFDLQGANLEGLRIPFSRWRGQTSPTRCCAKPISMALIWPGLISAMPISPAPISVVPIFGPPALWAPS